MKGYANMNDLEEFEEKALDFASDMAGEYLESIGKTDLATLSPEEWRTFLQVVGLNFFQKRIELMPCPF